MVGWEPGLAADGAGGGDVEFENAGAAGKAVGLEVLGSEGDEPRRRIIVEPAE